MCSSYNLISLCNTKTVESWWIIFTIIIFNIIMFLKKQLILYNFHSVDKYKILRNIPGKKLG